MIARRIATGFDRMVWVNMAGCHCNTHDAEKHPGLGNGVLEGRHTWIGFGIYITSIQIWHSPEEEAIKAYEDILTHAFAS